MGNFRRPRLFTLEMGPIRTRNLLALLASAGVLGSGAVAADALIAPGAVSAASQTPPRAQLRDLVCRQAAHPFDRLVGITAVMRPVAGTMHMRLRFSLLAELTGWHAFHPLRGGVLGIWISPRHDPDLGQQPGDRWIVKEPVVNVAPGAYRFRVRFRWLGGGGQLLASVVRSSPVCRERG